MATLGLKSVVGAAKKGIIQGTKAAVEKFITKQAAADAIKAETIAAKSFTKIPGTAGKSFVKQSIKELRLKGVQVHHVIPENIKVLSEHELVKLAKYDVQASYNKMLLPSSKARYPSPRTVHRGPQNKEAVMRLKDEMDKAYNKGLAEGWTTERFKEKLMEIVQKERKDLRAGKLPLNNAQ